MNNLTNLVLGIIILFRFSSTTYEWVLPPEYLKLGKTFSEEFYMLSAIFCLQSTTDIFDTNLTV